MQIKSQAPGSPLPWMKRGFSLAYRPGETNHCPGCGREHWLVGRMVAQCGFCDTALPLDHISTYSASPRISRHGVSPRDLPADLQAVA